MRLKKEARQVNQNFFESKKGEYRDRWRFDLLIFNRHIGNWCESITAIRLHGSNDFGQSCKDI